MIETTKIMSCWLEGKFVYIVVLYFKDTGEYIIGWRCNRLKDAWQTSYEVNRILREGEK